MAKLMTRLAEAARYVATGTAASGIGQSWFGPLPPLSPMAPQVAGRQFDLRPGINLDLSPRAGEGIDFVQLRALADNYDMLRIVIEKRKEQLAAIDWEILPRNRDQDPKGDSRIRQASDFFTYPDRINGFDQWARMLVEDMLVIDAATLYPRRTRGGDPYALEIIDGATIKVLVDDYGRRPAPPDPAYQQILHGLPAVNYTIDELIYLPRNPRSNRLYGLSPVAQIVITVNLGLRRQMHKLQYYTEGTVPDAFAGLPMGWSMGQIREFQDYFDALLSDNTAQRRKIRFVPETIAKAFVQTKSEALKDDYDEWLARIVCYCMQVSNQAFIKQTNRSTSETAQEQALNEGLEPLKIWLKSVVDRAIDKIFGWPDLELRWKETVDQDPQVAAQIADTNLRNGKITLNEARAQDGLPPIVGGDTHLIYTGQGAVTLESILHPPMPPVALADPKEVGGAAGRPFVKAAGAANRADALFAAWSRYFVAQREAIATALRAPLLKADQATDPAIPTEADAAAIADDLLAATPGAARVAVQDATEAALVDEFISGADAGQALLTQATTGPAAPIAETGAAGAASSGGAEAGVIAGRTAAVDVFRLAHPDAVAYAAENAAEKVSQIDDTTRAALRDLVTHAQEEGWGEDKLVHEIQGAAAFDQKRARLIANYELGKASEMGKLAVWKKNRDRHGARVRKQVVLGLLENHCPACKAAADQGPIDLDDSFIPGFAPPFHPRCGCFQAPVIGGEEVAELVKVYNPGQPRGSDGEWIPEIEAARGRAAIEHVLATKNTVHDAMRVPGIGKVAFVWGEPGTPPKHEGGYGIAKISAKHGEDSVREIPNTLAFGTIDEKTPAARRVIRHGDFKATLTFGGSGPEDQNWVLSHYAPDK